MNLRSISVMALGFVVMSLQSCSKDEDIPIIPPSTGAEFQLNGGEGGSGAANSVYVDLSGPNQDSVKRSSWDLGFYSGSNFRVILNNTTTALGKMLDKNDLNQVSAADTVGWVLSLNQMNPSPAEFAMLDDINGDLSKTLISEISANAADNKVYIINRGTGGAIAARDWMKIRVLRNGDGYTVQYATLDATSFQTIDVSKDSKYHFTYASLSGNVVKVEPEKTAWDFVWTYSVFITNFGVDVPYSFSDLIAINYLSGVQAAEVLTSTVSYEDYSEANIATTAFTGNRWEIGSKWRATAAPGGGTPGVKTDRFYVIKDAAGNIYKLKFISFIAQDGGTRGKPQISFTLVKAV